ncbi:MAG: exodeoxyribonuclease V subunit gamma [Xanthomonadaceae bacterium]|jgi:exodeoxyribonuclease V gamma subunit|nr:exodeoxyribonuclease V subunit gamma [Xanthomonadaceae bacterium]
MTGLPVPRFNLVSGNRLDDLAAALAERLSRPVAVDDLRPETILIPQPTLRRWLQVELARRLGVAANLEFLTPSEFVWRLLRAEQPGLPAESPWDQDRLRWRIHAQLNEAPPPAVAEHLQRSGGGTALARWRLAESLASAFDKYQAYRRSWLEAWERGEGPDDWQAILWRRLRGDASPPRSQLIDDWLHRHHAGDAPPPGLPPRLSAFGTINVSPDVLRLLAVAAQYRELTFYRPTPCAEYWGDIEPKRRTLALAGLDMRQRLAETQADNPLLKAWGEAGRDFVAQLFSYELVRPAQEEELFEQPPRDSLLHAIQGDVLNRVAPTPLDGPREDDGSIQVHACHSRLREVEVLHDRLLAMFAHDPALQPHEVAVLAPNIGDYLPLVRAVFGGVPATDPRHIPFTLSDRPQAQSHPLVGLFLSLLDLPQSRRTVSEVLDLLAIPAVMRAVDLDDADLEWLQERLGGAGVRWGDDETMRERLGFGRWREYSFAFGLDRLLMGYATGEGEGLIGGIAPFAELEGSDSERLDRLLRVLRRLQHLSIWQRASHTAPEWRSMLAQQFLALLPEAATDAAEQQARRMVLETLEQFALQAEGTGALPVDVMAAALRDMLQAPSPHQPFLGGGVTFAGMVPLRTVPFRVICLLGMDADAFPRREAGGDINRLIEELHGGRKWLGDRSVREDDRFLFLQLLTAARDVFYISYGGRDTRDDRWLEPSTLVAELLDAALACRPAGNNDHPDAYRRLVLEHPLQPFSAQAFGAGDQRRFSYRHEWWQPQRDFALIPPPCFVGAAALSVDDMDAGTDEPSLTLNQLQMFFRNPPRAFLRDTLGLLLPSSGDRERDDEPMGDNALAQYQLKQYLFEHDETDETLRARGELAPGRDGGQLARRTRQSATALRARAGLWLREEAGIPPGLVTYAERSLRIDSHRLPRCPELPARAHSGGPYVREGSVVFANPRAVLLASSAKGKHRLPALIEHLLLAAQIGTDATTALFFTEKKQGAEVIESVPLPALDADAARVWLDDLVTLYRQGLARPLPFAPDAAWKYAGIVAAGGSEEAGWKAAVGVFDDYQGFGDSRDPWFRQAFLPYGLLADFDAPSGAEFRELALRVFLGPASVRSDGGGPR